MSLLVVEAKTNSGVAVEDAYEAAMFDLRKVIDGYRERLVNALLRGGSLNPELHLGMAYSKLLCKLLEAKESGDTEYLATHSSPEYFTPQPGFDVPRAYTSVRKTALYIAWEESGQAVGLIDTSDLVDRPVAEVTRLASGTKFDDGTHDDPTANHVVATITAERRQAVMRTVVGALSTRASGYSKLSVAELDALAGMFDPDAYGERRDPADEREARKRTGQVSDPNRGTSARYAETSGLSKATVSRLRERIIESIGRTLYLAGVLGNEGVLNDAVRLHRVLDAFDTAMAATVKGGTELVEVTKAARSVRPVDRPRTPLEVDDVLTRAARVHPDLFVARGAKTTERLAERFDRGQWSADPDERAKAVAAIHSRETSFAATIDSPHPMCVETDCRQHGDRRGNRPSNDTDLVESN